MASTYNYLGIEKMATGENAGTWGTKTNTNLDIIQQAASGYHSQSLNLVAAGANTTALAITDGDSTSVTDALTNAARNTVIELTGTITGNKIATFPTDTEGLKVVFNNTSGAYTVQLKGASDSGSGTTFSTTDKGKKLIYMSGTDLVEGPSGTVTASSTTTFTNKTFTAPKYADDGFTADASGNENLVWGTTSNAVNEFKMKNAATTNGPILSVQGGDANVPMNLTTKGTGDVFINPPSTGSLVVNGNSTQAGKIKLYNDTDAGTYFASFQPGTLTEDTAYILPTADAGTSGDALTSNASGTLSWTTMSGGVSWQAVETGATMTAVAGNGYFINTTSNACTATLPAGTIGDEVNFIDYAGTFDSNNLTVAANGSEKIHGSTDDLTVAVERAGFALVFTDTTQGWLLKDK